MRVSIRHIFIAGMMLFGAVHNGMAAQYCFPYYMNNWINSRFVYASNSVTTELVLNYCNPGAAYVNYGEVQINRNFDRVCFNSNAPEPVMEDGEFVLSTSESGITNRKMYDYNYCSTSYQCFGPTKRLTSSGCQTCPPGSSAILTGWHSISDCYCPATHYYTDSGCIACPANSMGSSGANHTNRKCSYCTQNYYNNSAGDCVRCPNGGMTSGNATTSNTQVSACLQYSGISGNNTRGSFTYTSACNYSN